MLSSIFRANPSYLASFALIPAVWKLFDANPSLIHGETNSKLSRELRSIRHIAHRGSTEEGIPENSMAAFRHAIDQGVCCIELDVRQTRDKKIVIFHDPNLSRMTSNASKKSIEEMNYADLPFLKPSNSAQVTDGDSMIGRHKIPLLEEVLGLLDKHPELRMIVEFKTDQRDLIEDVHKLIEMKDRKERIVWFSLSTGICKKLRMYDPSMPTIVSAPEVFLYLIFHYFGMLPFVTIPFCIFGITLQDLPYERLKNEKALAAIPNWVKLIISYAVQGCPPWLLASPSMFRHLQERGVPIWFLGCNEDRHLSAAEELGANAILTDKPRWLKQDAPAYKLRDKGARS